MTIRIRTIGVSLTASSWLLAACKDPLAIRTACIGLGLVAGGTIWPLLERGGWSLAGKCRDIIHNLGEPTITNRPAENSAVKDKRYNHAEINEFYQKTICGESYIDNDRIIVIENLLALLDQHGDCPSVIRNPGNYDANNEYDVNSYNILARTPLYKHSLEVANAMTKHTTELTFIRKSDAIIVGLAHDLGKIPMWHNEYPKMPHCELSALILKEIAPTYSALANHTELTSSISEHHNLTPGTMIGMHLKNCNLSVKKNDITENGQNGDLMQKTPAGATV